MLILSSLLLRIFLKRVWVFLLVSVLFVMIFELFWVSYVQLLIGIK